MSSIPSSAAPASSPGKATTSALRWRSWPLVGQPRMTVVAIASVLAVGGVAKYVSGSWLAGFGAVLVLVASLWEYWLPTTYEVLPSGLRRKVLGRAWLTPWHAVRSYRPLATGIVLYQRPDPTTVDALRSVFLPYPADEDELLCAVREHLGHAVELP